MNGCSQARARKKTKAGNVDVYYRNLKATFTGDQPVCDDVINGHMALMEQSSTKQHTVMLSTHAHTHFRNLWRLRERTRGCNCPTGAHVPRSADSCGPCKGQHTRRIRAWFKSYDLQIVTKIIIPLHICEYHWAYIACHVTTHRLVYVDSKQSVGLDSADYSHEQLLKDTTSWLNLLDFKQQANEVWTLEIAPVADQGSNSTCALHTCVHMYCDYQRDHGDAEYFNITEDDARFLRRLVPHDVHTGAITPF